MKCTKPRQEVRTEYQLSLYECRELYESVFETDLPENVPYHQAARSVLRVVGERRFAELVNEMREVLAM